MIKHLIRRIKNNEQMLGAIEWWGDSENCGESEMKLVTFLLGAAGKVPIGSKEKLREQFVDVLKCGYTLPENTIYKLKHGK